MSVRTDEFTQERCPITGKRIYITRAKADVYAGALNRKNRQNGDRHPVHPFRCECGCGHWHIGHVQSRQGKRWAA